MLVEKTKQGINAMPQVNNLSKDWPDFNMINFKMTNCHILFSIYVQSLCIKKVMPQILVKF